MRVRGVSVAALLMALLLGAVLIATPTPAAAQLCGTASVSPHDGPPGTTFTFSGGGWYGGCHADNPYFWIVDGNAVYAQGFSQAFSEVGQHSWDFCTWQTGCSQCCDSGTFTVAGPPPPTPTPKPDLIADALEITQAVQDLNNSVRLVANKQTYVRFHAYSNRGEHLTRAKLRVDDGRYVRELLPINPHGEIIVRPNPSRDALNDSFLFAVPSGLFAGPVTFTGEVNPLDSPQEENRENNTLRVTVTFETVPAANLVLYPVGWGPHPQQEASDLHITKLASWLRRAYPISYLHFRWKRGYDAGMHVPTCEQVNAFLSATRLWDVWSKGAAPTTRYYGMVYDGGGPAGFMRGCAMGIPSFVASGPTGDRSANPASGLFWDKDGSYGDWYGGHELAHTWGRRHPGFCNGQQADPAGSRYPYPDGKISQAGNRINAFFGFDIETEEIYGPDWTDLMTYCQFEWVSDFFYEGLMDQFQNEGGPAGAAAAAALEANQTDRLLVAGSIDPATNQVELQPLFVLPGAGELTQRIPGAYAIVLRNAGGAELVRYPFTPHQSHVEADDQQMGEAPLLFIEETVPFVAGTTRVDIEGPSGLQHTIVAGSHPPTIHITAPGGGQSLIGETIAVRWTADDIDGDPLSFNVQYSRDDGTTWHMMAQNLSGDGVDLDARNVPGGLRARFRVWASDGMHTASDESQMVTVPNRIPTITIVEPAGPVTIAAGQTLMLQADAYDVETGSMDEEVEWISSRDGVLGSGAWLGIADLSVGLHAITARADDGTGGVATDTVQVTVVSDLSELPPVPDRLAASPSLIAFAPAAGATSATLRIENENVQQALAWQAVASADWIQLGAAAGTTPAEVTVSFVNTGLAAGHHSAAITISSAATPEQAKTIGVEVAIAQQPSCTGDCSGDNRVTVDELLTGVNIALGQLSVDACRIFDSSGDGAVTIDELLEAVNRALDGCAPLSPSPTTPIASVTRTVTATPKMTSVSPNTTPTATAPPPTFTRTATPTMSPVLMSPTPTRSATYTPMPAPTTPGTGHLYCRTSVLAIPDHDENGVGDSITITDQFTITDLNVRVQVEHPYVGDVAVALFRSEDPGSFLWLIFQPGPESIGGCGGANIACTLDDQASQWVDYECADTVPTIQGRFRPGEPINTGEPSDFKPLSTFNGQSSAGTWGLWVYDLEAADTGSLTSWCLEMN
jgi:hypothetical protein